VSPCAVAFAGMAVALAMAGCGTGAGGTAHPSPAGSTTGGDPTADGDADYLTDAEEAQHGTDPESPDTDGDTYLDGDEVLEGTDPLDPKSRIYQGGWPYQRFKDDIADPGFDGAPAIGSPIPRLVATDQFGETVDLYDFAKHGRPVVLDLSAVWCGPCKDLATWLAGKPSTLDMKPEFASIPSLVSSGKIYWITIVFEDAIGNPAGPEEAAAWAEAYPNPKVAVLADDNRAMYEYVFPGAMPSITVINEDMTLRVYDRFDYEPALTSLLQ